MKSTKHLTLLPFLALALVLGSISMVQAQADPIRIVVLPFYVEDGADTKDAGVDSLHYRRMMRFINNQLVGHNFEVINPAAHDAGEKEIMRVMDISREDSSLASMEVCKKYGVDAAYISWLKVKIKKTSDGYCKASARLDGEGYDSAGHDLGAGVSKTFKVTKRDCDDAIAEVEKEVGDLVGRKLTASSVAGPGTVMASDAAGSTVVPASQPTGGGVLKQNIRKNAQYVTVRLNGANQYELVEVFGKVLKSASGVEYAKNYGQRIVSDNPQASYVTWRATISDTDAFILQANIMKMLSDVDKSGGEIVLKGVPYRYTPAELQMLKGIRPGDASSRDIQFVLDRERVRDLEFSQTNNSGNQKANKFE